MKSIDLPHFQSLPEPQTDKLPQPVVGESAVHAEERRVRHGLEADDAARKLAVVEQLLESRVPDPRFASVGSTIMSRVLRKPFSTPEGQEELKDWVSQLGNVHYKHVGADLHRAAGEHLTEELNRRVDVLAELTMARSNIAQIPAQNHEKVDKHFQGEDVPEVFKDWKKNAEHNRGTPMSWVDWLSTEAPEGTQYNELKSATNDQLLNVLQWSNDRLHRLNEDPKVQEKIAEYKQRTEQALKAAVADGELSPKLLERFQDGSDDVPIFIGDVLDKTLADSHGYFDSKTSQIIIESTEDMHVAVHERLHNKGGFKTRWLDEAETERYTHVTMRHDTEITGEPDHIASTLYSTERSMTNNLYLLADLSEAEVSEIYAGHNDARNEQRLGELIEQKVGADVLGYVKDYSDQIFSEVARRELLAAGWKHGEDVMLYKDIVFRQASMESTRDTAFELNNLTTDAMRHVMNNAEEGVNVPLREAVQKYVQQAIVQKNVALKERIEAFEEPL